MKFATPILLAFAMCLPTIVCGQQQEPVIQKFEVASVKRSLSTGGVIYHLPGGRFKATGLTLLNLIGFAYDIPDDQIQGLPSWGSKARFDVEATADAPLELNPAKMETPLKKVMVKQLLAERFALEVKREERTVPTYSLVESPKGNKLERNTDKPYLIHAGRRSYIFQKATMSALAKQLSVGVRKDIGKPVIDETGIVGEFDFQLFWGPARAAAFTSSISEPATVATADDLPSIFDALQQQLGLQLKADHASLQFLVVVAAQVPTAN